MQRERYRGRASAQESESVCLCVEERERKERRRDICVSYHSQGRHDQKMAIKAVVVLKDTVGVGRHPLPLHKDVLEARDLVGRLLHVRRHRLCPKPPREKECVCMRESVSEGVCVCVCVCMCV